MADSQWHGYSLYRPIQRSKFSEKQQEILAQCFDKNQYPDHSLKVKISKKTGLDAEQVRIWFQNKRARKRSGMVNEEPQKHVQFYEEKDKQSFSVAEKKANGEMTSSSQEVVELLRHVNEIINGKVLHVPLTSRKFPGRLLEFFGRKMLLRKSENCYRRLEKWQ